jgi:O-acetyl-ADP-ribose deacetylase (regulator of RNase III)
VTKPLVFVSYCQKDAVYRDELVEEVLKPYRQQGFIEYWYDQSLEPGQEHKQEILNNLERASATIFLVSSRLVSSWFIQNEELPRVLKAYAEGRMKIFWLLLKPLDLALVKDLAALQALANPSTPLNGMNENERGEVWMRLGIQLRQLSESTAQKLEATVPAAGPVAAPIPARPVRVDEIRSRGSAITVVNGDLTKEEVDAAIVSASRDFRADGGIEMAFHQAAGNELRAALRTRPHLGVTQTCVTPGFNVPARTLVHALSPSWRGDPRNDLALLHQTYDNAFGAAIAAGARSIALGSFGTGSKGFPADVAAGIAVEAARRAIARGPEGLTIRFVVQDPKVQSAFEEELSPEVARR